MSDHDDDDYDHDGPGVVYVPKTFGGFLICLGIIALFSLGICR